MNKEWNLTDKEPGNMTHAMLAPLPLQQELKGLLWISEQTLCTYGVKICEFVYFKFINGRRTRKCQYRVQALPL
jgi:hypothetical protein